jgi:hypothetical protein
MRFQITLLPTMGLLELKYLGLRGFGKLTGTWLGVGRGTGIALPNPECFE